MELIDVRKKIDEIDKEITKLFCDRMEIVNQVANIKKENNLPILNTTREREIIANATKDMDDFMAEYTKMFYTTIFDLSRSAQESIILEDSKLSQKIQNAIEKTPKVFPKNAVVACQGIEGANSSLALDKLFSRASVMYMNSFDAVFKAVDNGLCAYGILPIENSLHGSVTQVYDLMKEYDFYIAKVAKIKINHTLLSKAKDVKQIKEIYSHGQAIAQCSKFLKSLGDVKVIECDNTAIAAEMVAKSDRNDVAAIASRSCSELYKLNIISDDIQNNDNNYTRFICISKDMQIFPGANKISMMFTIPHRPGALYNIISKFSALGVNMSKLESRPIAGKDFEFMFYIDLDADVNDPCVKKLLSQLQNSAQIFAFLGSYSEV